MLSKRHDLNKAYMASVAKKAIVQVKLYRKNCFMKSLFCVFANF